MKHSRRNWMVAAATCAAFFPGLALAQPQWPDKPVRVVVPWAPGGITDILARVIAQKLTDHFGQQFVIDNKGGASGNIGAELVARAPADGYTLLLTNPGAFTTNQYLYADMKYRPADFAPIIVLAKFPNALMVNKDLPVKTAMELVVYAKKNPAALNGGSSGTGSSGHLSLEMFKSMTGAPIQNVFYKGAAPTKIDLSAGRIQVVLDNIPGYLSELQSGSVRMLAVGTKTRLETFPDVPTLDEAGVTGYEASVWYAMAAPAGTPQSIIQSVNAAAQAALNAPDVKDRLKLLQGLAVGGSPGDAAKFFSDESARWKTIIEKTGTKVTQ
jgi:tripartite-type tricarboxylate transporter receptor subunit TctC